MATVSPSYDDQGNLVDFHVDHGRRPSGLATPDRDFVERNDGTYEHIYQDVTLESDLDDVSTMRFNPEDYLSALTQTNPDLIPATQWALTAPEVSQAFRDEWSQVLNSMNLERLNEMSEQLIENYLSTVSVPEKQPIDQEIEELDEIESAIDEWYDNLDGDFIDETINDLMSTEYTEEDVNLMSSLEYTYEENTPHRDILTAGQLVASGDLSIDAAIEQICDTYGEAAATAAYIQLNHDLNNYG